MPTSPLFSLASFAIPPRWQNPHRVGPTHTIEVEFKAQVDAALKAFIERLPLGASLIVEHECQPSGSGAPNLQTTLSVAPAPNATVDSRQVAALEVCLGTLSDFLSFRRHNGPAETARNQYPVTLQIRPHRIPCSPETGPIGFITSEILDDTIYLPALEYWEKDTTRSQVWPDWSHSLNHVFKATRGYAESFRFRICVTRDELAVTTLDQLIRLQSGRFAMENCDCKTPTVTELGKVLPPTSQLALMKHANKWVSSSPTAFRVDLEIDCHSQGSLADFLLELLQEEIFFTQNFEPPVIVPLGVGPTKREDCDLTNLYPIADGLVPLFADLHFLESLNFPRHYSNPSFDLPADGILLGTAQMNGFTREVRMLEEDRSRHTYILGSTGTGKSTELRGMLRQDIEAGRGVAIVDPHGDLIDQVISIIPPERFKDVIRIDPSDPTSTVSLNPLDFSGGYDTLEVNRVITDLLEIFGQLYNMREAGGPGFEQYFRNVMLLASVAEGTSRNAKSSGASPGEPPTFVTAIDILSDRDYREYLLSKCKTGKMDKAIAEGVVTFFENAGRTSGDQNFANWVPYISSKLTRWVNNPILRKLMCTPKRNVNFREILDDRKILLVDLNKGVIGDQDTQMIGMLITKYLFRAALSRSDIRREDRVPFYYYVDEFHNFVTPDIPNLLAEARKFGLRLVFAHQNLQQLVRNGATETLDAVLGNVATQLIFRVGLNDAKTLEPLFQPQFDGRSLSQLPDRHVMARILVNHQISPALVFETVRDFGESAMLSDQGFRAWATENAAKAAVEQLALADTLTDAAAEIVAGAEKPAASDSAVSAESTKAKTMLMPAVGGLLQVAYSANGPKLKETLAPANQLWSSVANRKLTGAAVALVSIEIGAFYWTENNSLVLVLAELDDQPKHCYVLVLTGGHGASETFGEWPGEKYIVNAAGCHVINLLPVGFLGMNLREKAEIRFSATEILTGGGSNLAVHWHQEFGQPGKQPILDDSRGFYLTANGSLVFVVPDKKRSTRFVVFVCRGGHGVPKVGGKCFGERYYTTKRGQVEIEANSRFEELRSWETILLGGMALVAQVQLIGELPEGLSTE